MLVLEYDIKRIYARGGMYWIMKIQDENYRKIKIKLPKKAKQKCRKNQNALE